MYGPNGVDLSAFKRTSSGIDKPLERSFGSICKWLQRGFHVDPLTHVITVQSLVNWEVESELWELMMIHSTDDWQKYMQAALERVVAASWKDELEARFALVDRVDEAGPINPHPRAAGTSKTWFLQFTIRIHSKYKFNYYNSHVPLIVETIYLNCLCSLPFWLRMPTSTV